MTIGPDLTMFPIDMADKPKYLKLSKIFISSPILTK